MPMRVVSSELDPHKKHSDVSGTHTVLYPTSDAEVKEALTVARVLGARKVLVRSGRHAADNQPVDGTDAMVVNLRNHSGIEIDSNNNVTVCAGATTSNLAAKLKAHNLFLPLDGNPDKSVFSNVRSTELGFLPAFGLGAFLTGSQGINKESMEFVENVPNEGSGTQEEHIITKMVFKAKTVDDVKDYRMTRLCFTYDRTLFGDVLRHVFFGENKLVAGGETDVRVTVFSGAYEMPLFTVTTISPRDSNYITEMVKRLDPTGDLIIDASAMAGGDEPIGDAPAGRKKVVMTTDTQEGTDIVEAVAQEGKGGRYLYEKHRTRYSGELAEGKLDAYVDAVHRAVAFSPTPILPRVKMISTASSKAQDGVGLVGVHMSLHAPLPKNQTSAEKKLHHDVAEAINSRAQVASQVDLDPQVAAGKLVGLDVGKRVDIAIDGFAGEVYCEGMDGYDAMTQQYATSSYTDEVERMTPYAIGYPGNTADVEAFVKFAIQNGKKVVVRSGGHQYCGLSSGGSDTMLLSMDAFDKLKVDELGEGEVVAQVGPGAHLTNLAAEFAEKKVTIPHGECPQVCIGGHIQTGGYGHILCSHGLALDHVKSFDIVLAHPEVELRTITRPTCNVEDDTSSSNDRIFWGVLGGGAGSFGVITNVEFDCIKDLDHSDSRGYQGGYLYHKSVLKATMAVVQKRTEDVFKLDAVPGESNQDVLPSDCDLMVSVLSGNSFNPDRLPTISVEMVHANCGGLPLADNDVGLVRMKKEINDINESYFQDPHVRIDPNDHTSLSSLSNAFVRNSGTTDDGREYPYPYVKRVNCTTKPLSSDFIDKFVDLIHKAMCTRGIKFVYQMVLGGGAYQGNGKGKTSISHRDIVIGIVFDCFHFDNAKGKHDATNLHNEFGDLVESSWGEDIRMTWGSFGEIDMNKVHEEYYGRDNGLYERLQTLKQDVDPLDHFHTPFTVQLPTPPADEGEFGGEGADGRAGKRARRKR